MISKIPQPYSDRLEFIREMLDSPQPEMALDGYDLLFKLWLEYSADTDFCDELKKIGKKHPELPQEFTDRLDDLPRTETEKAVLLKSIILLNPLESMREIQPAEKAGEDVSQAITPKIFISYSHKAEKYKDELVKMLAPLQDQGVLTIWQDREIEPGEEWYGAIQNAMNTCDLALLLVSGDFLASRFIRDEELSRLLQRRKDDGLRVVPIIVSDCLWQSIPVLRDLQALPKNGRAIISFKGTGGRDRVWMEIAKAIESIVKGIR